MSRVTQPKRRQRARSQRSDASAYWISDEQAHAIRQYGAEEDVGALAEIIKHGAKPVPGGKEFETTLVGELLNVLVNGGVPVPPAQQSPYGILITVEPRESAAIEDGIQRFMEQTDDETLASDPSLILYSEETDLVKRGIDYLRKGLKIPSEYDALLLLAR